MWVMGASNVAQLQHRLWTRGPRLATRSSLLDTVGLSVPRVALALWHDQHINTRLVEDARGAEVRAPRRVCGVV